MDFGGSYKPPTTRHTTPRLGLRATGSLGNFGPAIAGRNKVKTNPVVKKFQPYEFHLSFYQEPPEGDMDLETAEKLVQERLEVLSTLAAMIDRPKNNLNDYWKDVQRKFKLIKSQLGHELPFILAKKRKGATGESLDQRREDHISHFLLRLYFCRTDEMRRWFVSNEVELMRLRLYDITHSHDNISDAKIDEILAYNGFEVDPYNPTDLTDFKFKVPWKNILSKGPPTTYYRFPFEETLELVKSRRVVIRDGFALIDQQEMASIIVAKYRQFLNKSLADLFLVLSDLGEEERLLPRIGGIYDKVTAQAREASRSEKTKTFQLDRSEIDDLSRVHFPPCMRTIHRELVDKSHIKHFARIHYGLFLKGLGLPVEEALLFFRDHFTKSAAMSAEQFQRNYAYNIRYNYGLEGRRKEMSPYSCIKIFSQPPGPGDCHGCPFKTMDSRHLTAMLTADGVKGTDADDVLHLAGESNPTGACLRYFQATHGYAPREGAIYHPNQYALSSRRGNVGTVVKEEEDAERVTLVEGQDGDGPDNQDPNGDQTTEKSPELEHEQEMPVGVPETNKTTTAATTTSEMDVTKSTDVGHQSPSDNPAVSSVANDGDTGNPSSETTTIGTDNLEPMELAE